jgi:phosphate starvation-inducible PhoH-like protein
LPKAASEGPSTARIDVQGVLMVALFGSEDRLLKTLENTYPEVEVHARGNSIVLQGKSSQVAAAKQLVEEMIELIQAGQDLLPQDFTRSAKMIEEGAARPADVLSQSIISSRGKTIRPKTLGQKTYVDAIDNNTIVFGIGPAGTGKTYLAMAKAVQALQRKEISRIILTRPAVEAGEKLGFLPGTLNDKIDPYLRPLFDALHDMLDPESIPKLMTSGTIEVAPLAYMRGRTLNDAFIILDEAQNTTPEQMKMFLTRLGFNSKMIVTGDVTQIDLPNGTSGLKLATEVLSDVEDMHFSLLTSDDVVRHTLVAKIVDAYSKHDDAKIAKKAANNEAAQNRIAKKASEK